MKIIIVGLGPGNPRHLTREANKYLAEVRPLYFRTSAHPAVRRYLSGKGAAYSFDRLYEENKDFEKVYRAIVASLIAATRRHGTICYAVPGHPFSGEATVKKLCDISARLGIEVRVVAGLSFLEPLLTALKIDLLDGFTIYDALDLTRLKEPCRNHLIIAQVYNRTIASEVKLRLLEIYPSRYPVTVVRSAGLPSEQVRILPLHALDHKSFFNHSTTLYLPPSDAGAMGNLIETMARLRAENGCPWDKKQTHSSLRQYVVEEAYEVVAAIDRFDDEALCNELGDLLLQVVFHSQIAREENRFDFWDVVDSIITKLIRRHPHVFGREKAEDAQEVKLLWEKIKERERKVNEKAFSLSVDQGLPALLKAYKLQKRAAEVGFDWPAIEGPLEKAQEELRELEAACRKNDPREIEEELGDFLFTVVNLSRFLNINPELALGKTIGKFVTRFQYVTEQAEKAGQPLDSFSLEVLDGWWEEAKKKRRNKQESKKQGRISYR